MSCADTRMPPSGRAGGRTFKSLLRESRISRPEVASTREEGPRREPSTAGRLGTSHGTARGLRCSRLVPTNPAHTHVRWSVCPGAGWERGAGPMLGPRLRDSSSLVSAWLPRPARAAARRCPQPARLIASAEDGRPLARLPTHRLAGATLPPIGRAEPRTWARVPRYPVGFVGLWCPRVGPVRSVPLVVLASGSGTLLQAPLGTARDAAYGAHLAALVRAAPARWRSNEL